MHSHRSSELIHQLLVGQIGHNVLSLTNIVYGDFMVQQLRHLAERLDPIVCSSRLPLLLLLSQILSTAPKPKGNDHQLHQDQQQQHLISMMHHRIISKAVRTETLIIFLQMLYFLEDPFQV